MPHFSSIFLTKGSTGTNVLNEASTTQEFGFGVGEKRGVGKGYKVRGIEGDIRGIPAGLATELQ